jgi:oligopeptide/dipeptide ABC transporter ATP-binding protein
MSGGTLLEVENLFVGFRSPAGMQPAVQALSFTVAPGQTVAMVGESGCGKSVTALALLGLLPAYAEVSGHILWRGRNLMAMADSERRTYRGRHLGMVFQEPATSLNPVYPVGEQVAEALRYHHSLSHRAARRKTLTLFEEVRIPDARARVDAYPHQLSGGMRQRVMLAAALACDPELLVADEPTTALDVTVQAQILDLLARLQQERGMAMIFITHDLALVPALADRIIVLYAGHLVESGPASAVISSPAHPYTRALVQALPELWPADDPSTVPAGDASLAPAGKPRSGSLPQATGCPYAQLCPHARSACHERFPAEVSVAPDRRSACLPEVAATLASRRAVP